MTAVMLIIVANLFPPYWDYLGDSQGNVIGARTKWELNRGLLSAIDDIRSGRVGLNKGLGYGFRILEFPLRRGLLALETGGIVALAAVALLVTKKKEIRF